MLLCTSSAGNVYFARVLDLCVHFHIVYIVTNQAFTCVSSAAASSLLDTFHPTPFTHPVFLPDSYRALPSWSIASKVLIENLSFSLWIILQPPSSHPKYLVFLRTSIQLLVEFPQPGLLFGAGAGMGSFSLVVPTVPSTSVSGS